MPGSMPLQGVTVYEIGYTPAAAHAGRLLRQLGATVWRADLAHRPLIPPTSETVFDAGKRSAADADFPTAFDIVLDDHACVAGEHYRSEGSPRPRSRIAVLLRAADDAADPGLALGGTGLIAAAASGVSVAIGRPDRAPLGLPPGVIETVAGSQAVAAILAQIWHGTPESGTVTIEISMNGAIEFFVGMNTRVFDGYPRDWLREGRRTAGSGGPYPAAIFPCRDGFVGIIGRTKENWAGILEAMGSPLWAEEQGMRDPYFVGQFHAEATDRWVEAWTKDLTEQELARLALKHGFIVAPIRRLEKVLDEPQYHMRDFWEQDAEGRLSAGLPFVSTLKEYGGDRAEVLVTKRSVPPSQLLEGVRVLDFAWVWAGPMVSMILADLGAEVIKVEHPSRPDATRLRGRPCHEGASVEGPILEVAPYFHQLNHGKLSFGGDLGDPDVQKMLQKFAMTCDVVLENMRPGVLDRKSLAFAHLSACNPEIIMLSMTLAGQTGPLSEMRGYAPVMSGLAGLESQMGYPDGDLTGMFTFSFGDANAGIYGAISVLAALLERRRSGRGSQIDFSQVESTIATLTLQLSALQNGEATADYPNDDARYPFQSVVPCKVPSKWLAVTAADEVARRNLSAFLTELGYLDVGGDLGSALGRWTRTEDPGKACGLLRSRGVNAIPVRTWNEVVAARNASSSPITADIVHPYARKSAVYVPPWTFDGELPVKSRRAPLLGEHTRMLVDLTGVASPTEVERLIGTGALVQCEAGLGGAVRSQDVEMAVHPHRRWLRDTQHTSSAEQHSRQNGANVG